MVVLVVAVACRGDGNEAGQDLPGIPADSAGTAGLLIYRDAVAGQAVALNLSNGERQPVAGIAAGVAYSMSASACTRDGRLIAYANIAANGRASVVTLVGDGVSGRSIDVPGAIDGMAWAPGGERIAMTAADESGYHLTLLDIGSGATSTVPSGTGLPGPPRWSPDGQRLVVDINENGQSGIYVLEIATSNLVKVSTLSSAFTADWSPDGGTIVFGGTEQPGGFSQLFAVDADGKNERKLTNSDTQKWLPRWSLDGSLISYAGSVTAPAVSMLPAALHTQAVWVVSADGTNESQVTDIALDATPLAWCPPGPWLE